MTAISSTDIPTAGSLRWTETDEARAVEMYRAGIGLNEIAAIIGRSRAAVRERIKRLCPQEWEGGKSKKPLSTLSPHDHDAWDVLCQSLADGQSFEDVAQKLNVSVHHLLEWANYTYQRPVPQKRTTLFDEPKPRKRHVPLIYDGFAARKNQSWSKSTQGAREALEAFQ